jgi:hypothetical protein
LKIYYRNTDLDLVAAVNLNSLTQIFESQGMLLLHIMQNEAGQWSATFETDKQYDDPEANIAAMLSIIESLDEVEQNIWENLILREFNIGYDCGIEPRNFNQDLSNELLHRVALIGASLRITLYPLKLL